jgi:pimeloyl-ACP methyl ester carboxylesterase
MGFDLPPVSRRIVANGLSHHVLEWSGALPGGAPLEGSAPVVLLLHGFMDAAGTWDLVAPLLAATPMRVLAPDLRGFGDGARFPPGAYYHFPDYVFDVAELVDALAPGSAPIVVGHSMGGTVATLYAGAFPDRVSRVVLAEGVGPPDNRHEDVPDRMRAWIDQVRAVRARGERAVPSREEALRRLAANHPRVSPELLRTRLDALARDLPDGGVAWKADPLHTTRSPMPFFAESFKAFARRVTCPVLFVSGGPAGWHPADEEDRLAAFPHVERAELDAGHMMHWTRPDDFARLVRAFAGSARP